MSGQNMGVTIKPSIQVHNQNTTNTMVRTMEDIFRDDSVQSCAKHFKNDLPGFIGFAEAQPNGLCNNKVQQILLHIMGDYISSKDGQSIVELFQKKPELPLNINGKILLKNQTESQTLLTLLDTFFVGGQKDYLTELCKDAGLRYKLESGEPFTTLNLQQTSESSLGLSPEFRLLLHRQPDTAAGILIEEFNSDYNRLNPNTITNSLNAYLYHGGDLKTTLRNLLGHDIDLNSPLGKLKNLGHVLSWAGDVTVGGKPYNLETWDPCLSAPFKIATLLEMAKDIATGKTTVDGMDQKTALKKIQDEIQVQAMRFTLSRQNILLGQMAQNEKNTDIVTTLKTQQQAFIRDAIGTLGDGQELCLPYRVHYNPEWAHHFDIGFRNHEGVTYAIIYNLGEGTNQAKDQGIKQDKSGRITPYVIPLDTLKTALGGEDMWLSNLLNMQSQNGWTGIYCDHCLEDPPFSLHYAKEQLSDICTDKNTLFGTMHRFENKDLFKLYRHALQQNAANSVSDLMDGTTFTKKQTEKYCRQLNYELKKLDNVNDTNVDALNSAQQRILKQLYYLNNYYGWNVVIPENTPVKDIAAIIRTAPPENKPGIDDPSAFPLLFESQGDHDNGVEIEFNENLLINGNEDYMRNTVPLILELLGGQYTSPETLMTDMCERIKQVLDAKAGPAYDTIMANKLFFQSLTLLHDQKYDLASRLQ